MIISAVMKDLENIFMVSILMKISKVSLPPDICFLSNQFCVCQQTQKVNATILFLADKQVRKWDTQGDKSVWIEYTGIEL